MTDQNHFLLYTAPDGAVKVEVFVKDETAWLTQRALAELFGVAVPAVNKHLRNIYDSGELAREATISKMGIVGPEGARKVARDVEFYNLDAIIAVDYRADAPLNREFFATVQNRLHWAIAGQTAAELIYSSADATRIHMGLATWKHAPKGKILKSDVAVAKNT